MAHHNSMPFSTKDHDRDGHASNCANKYKGGWWYNSCHHSNPNGLYREGSGTVGVCWYHFHGGRYSSMKRMEMKIRRKA